jgi:hypothetical protein
MISVAENNLGTERLYDILRHSLDTAGRSHRHEYRGFDSLMRQMNSRATSARVRGTD